MISEISATKWELECPESTVYILGYEIEELYKVAHSRNSRFRSAIIYADMHSTRASGFIWIMGNLGLIMHYGAKVGRKIYMENLRTVPIFSNFVTSAVS